LGCLDDINKTRFGHFFLKMESIKDSCINLDYPNSEQFKLYLQIFLKQRYSKKHDNAKNLQIQVDYIVCNNGMSGDWW